MSESLEKQGLSPEHLPLHADAVQSACFAVHDSVAGVVQDLVRSYGAYQETSHLGRCPLPNGETVKEITDSLMDILYPGFHNRCDLHPGNIAFHVGDVLSRVKDKLNDQIARALIHESSALSVKYSARDDELKSQGITVKFLQALTDLRTILASDVRAAKRGDPACTSYHEVVKCYPGLEAISIYRMAHILHRLGTPLIPRMMTEEVHGRTGIDIHPGASIGPSFFIDHGTGVVIGETTHIGANVKIYQGVTLGALSFPTNEKGEIIREAKRHPTIEDNVVIYANATILGGDTVIGKDSVIGSNVWITKSVDAHTQVTIEKPKLHIKPPQDASHA